MARPSDYSPELAAQICQRISEGESLRAICRDETMPATSTVCLWLTKYAEFSEQYARAREAQADALAEEVLEIADDKTGDAQRDRLRFDARKWYAGKVAPKKYGDKVTNEHTGPDGGPVQASITVTFVKPDQG